MNLVYSDYYKNSSPYDSKKNEKFVIKKIGNLDNFGLRSRNICGIHRSINKYSNQTNNLELLKLCRESIYHSHHAVLKIREYKKDFDKDWWEIAKNAPICPDGWWKEDKNYKSKKFKKEDIEFSKKILEIKDNIYIFNLIRSMYKLTPEDAIKELLLEILWMSYRINKKIYEYENKV